MMTDVLRELDDKIAALFSEGSPILADAEPLPPPSVDQAITDEAVPEASAMETDGRYATMSEQPSSPLAGLDIDTAIRLRWALRDIKAKRTKLSPISPDDLKRLTELGLVEMHDEALMLTNEGMRLIARSIGPEGERGK
jgi:hypothetical protein